MICDYEYEPVRNYISLIGAAVALACLASILLLFLIEITGRRDISMFQCVDCHPRE